MFTSLPYISFQVNELWKAHMRHQYPAETLDKDIISLCAPSCLLQKVHLAFSHAQSYYPWTVSCDLFRINKKTAFCTHLSGKNCESGFFLWRLYFFGISFGLRVLNHMFEGRIAIQSIATLRIDEGLHIAALLRFCSIKVKR
jgi:hypothetical protein